MAKEIKINGDKFFQLLREKKLKQIDLARKLKIDKSGVSRWCNNINIMRKETINNIAKVLQIPAEEIITKCSEKQHDTNISEQEHMLIASFRKLPQVKKLEYMLDMEKFNQEQP